MTLDDINSVCSSMMAFMSDYGNEGAVLQQAEQEPGAWAWPGPTRATSIVACVPSFVDSSGESVAAGKGTARVGSVGTLGHIDPDEVDLEELAAQAAAEEFDIPEGAVKFDLTAEAVQAVLADQSYQVEAAEDIECPDTLVRRRAKGKGQATRSLLHCACGTQQPAHTASSCQPQTRHPVSCTASLVPPCSPCHNHLLPCAFSPPLPTPHPRPSGPRGAGGFLT